MPKKQRRNNKTDPVSHATATEKWIVIRRYPNGQYDILPNIKVRMILINGRKVPSCKHKYDRREVFYVRDDITGILNSAGVANTAIGAVYQFPDWYLEWIRKDPAVAYIHTRLFWDIVGKETQDFKSPSLPKFVAFGTGGMSAPAQLRQDPICNNCNANAPVNITMCSGCKNISYCSTGCLQEHSQDYHTQ